MEGGGQLIRTAIALASLLATPIQLFNIRGKRSKPGLKAQHLSGLKLIQDMFAGSTLTGTDLHSSAVSFTPPPISSNSRSGKTEFLADTKTAGAVCLLAQVSLPAAIFQNVPSSLILKGGTNADMAPTIEYYDLVFLPNIRRFGIDVRLDVVRKGYFPQGGGRVEFRVQPIKESLTPVILDEPTDVIREVVIYASVAGRVPLRVAEAMASGAMRTLKKRLPPSVPVKVHSFVEGNAFGSGASITLIGTKSNDNVFGGSAISSAKSKDAEAVGVKAAEDLLESLLYNVCVDSYMQDQFIIYMALAAGLSRISTTKATLHTRTGIHIAETLTTAKFTIIEDQSSCIIECKGIGYTRR